MNTVFLDPEKQLSVPEDLGAISLIVRQNGQVIELPLQLIQKEEWDAIPPKAKDVIGLPIKAWNDSGELNVWPRLAERSEFVLYFRPERAPRFEFKNFTI